jgi:hypothetical protein
MVDLDAGYTIILLCCIHVKWAFHLYHYSAFCCIINNLFSDIRVEKIRGFGVSTPVFIANGDFALIF